MASMPDDAEVYGVEVNKLQSGVTVDSNNVLHGTLHYVKDYDGYAKGAKGNFVALRLTAPVDATVSCKSDDDSADKPLTDNDRLIVWKVDRDDEKLTVKVERDGESAETVYSASGLTRERSQD